MLFPLAASVRAALRCAPQALVSTEAARRVEAAAAAVPSAMRAFGLECRLGADDGRVDFGGSVAAEGGGREVLAGLDDDTPLGAALLTRSEWRSVRDFARRWADPRTRLFTLVPLVFLELDLDSPADSVPLPSLFVRMRSSTAADTLDIVRALANDALASTAEGALVRCFSAMPRGGMIHDAAVMLARGTGSARLFGSAPAQQLPEYFADVGYAGDRAALREALWALYREPALVSFQIDVARAILPRIGLELSFAQSQEHAWRAALDRLVDLGLCAKDKREAFLSWPGRSREDRPGLGWPYVLDRTLSHLKVVWCADAWVEAKGYLWAEPRFSLVC